MVFSSKQENDYESQLEQIAGEVDSYLVKTDGALEYFREQIRPLTQRWKTYHEAADKRKKELLGHWEKVKKNHKLQDKNMKPSEELEWDRFYLLSLDSFGSNPINEMPAKYAPDVMVSLEKYLERNKKNEQGYSENSNEYKRLQETIAKQQQDLEDIRFEFDKLSSAEKKIAWIETPPKTVIPNIPYEKFMWWRYLSLEDENVFGCWRPPLIPLPEYPLDILKPVESEYQTRKELPDARNSQEEYERYYIFLSSVHDNYLQGVEKITEGIWLDNLQTAVLCCLDKGYGDKTAFLKAALERVCQSNCKTDKTKEQEKCGGDIYNINGDYVGQDKIGRDKAGGNINTTIPATSAIEMTRYGRAIKWGKNNWLICSLLIIFIVVIGLGQLTDAYNKIRNSWFKPNSLSEQEMDSEKEKQIQPEIIQQTMNDSPGGTQVAGDLYISETENTLHKPILVANATVEVKITSDWDFNGRVTNTKAHLAFVKGDKPLLITSSIGYTAKQTGNDEVVYKAKLDMDAKDSAVGNPASFLGDAEYIQIEFGRMPSDCRVLGGDVICIINNSISLKFSIPPQKLVNKQIFIRNLTESLQVLNEPGN